MQCQVQEKPVKTVVKAHVLEMVESDAVDAKCVLDGTAMDKVSATSSKISIYLSTKCGEAYESIQNSTSQIYNIN